MKHKWKLDEHGKPDEWSWDSGFCNGVYCERCGKTVCIHCNPLWEELDDCMEPPKPKPKTNAERIRAMSDEELEKIIAIIARFDTCINPGRDCEECPLLSLCENCLPMHELEWLQQPAKEG